MAEHTAPLAELLVDLLVTTPLFALQAEEGSSSEYLGALRLLHGAALLLGQVVEAGVKPTHRFLEGETKPNRMFEVETKPHRFLEGETGSHQIARQALLRVQGRLQQLASMKATTNKSSLEEDDDEEEERALVLLLASVCKVRWVHSSRGFYFGVGKTCRWRVVWSFLFVLECADQKLKEFFFDVEWYRVGGTGEI